MKHYYLMFVWKSTTIPGTYPENFKGCGVLGQLFTINYMHVNWPILHTFWRNVPKTFKSWQQKGEGEGLGSRPPGLHPGSAPEYLSTQFVQTLSSVNISIHMVSDGIAYKMRDWNGSEIFSQMISNPSANLSWWALVLLC